MIDEARLRELVRRVVHRAVGLEPSAPTRAPRLVTQNDLESVATGGELRVASGALITPLARQVAMERGVKLIEASGPGLEVRETAGRAALPEGSSPPEPRTVALGADHGGVELKQTLKDTVRSLGYVAIDCGTSGTESVDYPDFALAVAELVARGRAWRGILVDGAGIGSCIAANKVPGVRAALCYDEATAVNSRAHNDANVLTLGAGMIGRDLARAIVRTWLATQAEGGRHARRVGKIMDIERRFLRSG